MKPPPGKILTVRKPGADRGGRRVLSFEKEETSVVFSVRHRIVAACCGPKACGGVGVGRSIIASVAVALR